MFNTGDPDETGMTFYDRTPSDGTPPMTTEDAYLAMEGTYAPYVEPGTGPGAQAMFPPGDAHEPEAEKGATGADDDDNPDLEYNQRYGRA